MPEAIKTLLKTMKRAIKIAGSLKMPNLSTSACKGHAGSGEFLDKPLRL